MKPEHPAIPVLDAALGKLGLPLSLATKANGMVFVSGLPPLDIDSGMLITGTIEDQTAACMRALKHVLDHAGSSLDHVMMVRIYATNCGQYDRINKIYATFFQSGYPSRTFVPVAGWPMPFDLEIECVAIAARDIPA
ncbi:RidA family protein [Novacetimonas pomaceti]|uniref:RidA family protein n=1 Tax=Novacetimonas pomaceti TaxID=2021998 RepID=UPI001C2CF9CD|nr:RidA family protein [Novacetimonas pomaceti]MBV1835296.1 RidA family protein [Novacetimonas pomaceti]